MTFNKESEFEKALIELLTNRSWEKQVLKNPTEEDLIENWANILFNNNRNFNRLGDFPLTKTEMQQILDQINELSTPFNLNSFINGKTITIKRDHPAAPNKGKEVSLSIFDRDEVAGGKSRYQIAQQPKFKNHNPIKSDCRGDLMLLINGMPVIHIELKKSGVEVSQAIEQIKKYSAKGCFTGIFRLIQIFVAMTPEEMVYFINPGNGKEFKKEYQFHWCNYNNDEIKDWEKIADSFLYIPMAHELIGDYTIADQGDGNLKVLRSYQYFAVNRIYDVLTIINSENLWGKASTRGGYIWHTTGSGKTMTSFKAAQLIANKKLADKVVFLVDRIELATQSHQEYNNFAYADQEINDTKNTYDLINKLKASGYNSSLIITSIQKMNELANDKMLKASDLEKINKNRIVFIVDECHRSTFGTMFADIKKLFDKSVFFGFTGTPILEDNKKKDNTTIDVFGDELHRYAIADGIKDKNVLGFDHYAVYIFDNIKQQIALDKSHCPTYSDAINETYPERTKEFYRWMNEVDMVGHYDKLGKYHMGIEDYIPAKQYDNDKYRKAVIKNILSDFDSISRNRKFHGILATSSIPEAIAYYRLFKEEMNNNPDFRPIKITCIFDPSIDNNGYEKAIIKEDAMEEIIVDYNKNYNRTYTIPKWAEFKKDVANRLAHKEPHIGISNESQKDERLDLLIVVDQMLTGFDSKWINRLYLDKVLVYDALVQAFSRTNRIFGDDKPFGYIRYYRQPYTMEQNIKKAFEYYSGNKAFGVFVDKIQQNVDSINALYQEITQLFLDNNIDNFQSVPSSDKQAAKFASLFNQLWAKVQCAIIQGYDFDTDTNNPNKNYKNNLLDKTTFEILCLRYQELSKATEKASMSHSDDILYDFNVNILQLDTGKIDSEYLEDNFSKYIKQIQIDSDVESNKAKELLSSLQSSFSTLTGPEQQAAKFIINQIQSGDLEISPDKTFRDYINEHIIWDENSKIEAFCRNMGISDIQNFKAKFHQADSNAFGVLDEIRQLVDKNTAKAYLETLAGKEIPGRNLNREIYDAITKFIEKNK
ncbi:type I restriction endonuclease subunit R [Mycoplasma seminis]|uniref:Type I restriction enzyme endonuclease subunit n=1 Tax=Mycoplasma seminis TaxID=512749 RepID=A0ABY9HBR1_9MOLU|nr:HsdR family type I site-specific deoxyribonuclease [Mycoplasma seminis]WLP85696.1 HsdR family type I site-specific deoxyribonuclease [Mycoplasma seminis]